MAEFQVVMKQIQRMCSATNCGFACPIYDYCKSIANYPNEEDIRHIEETVMAWAAEHPEPVYPTWIEWFKQQNIWRKGTDNPALNLYNPIPADIAQKLGLQPK